MAALAASRQTHKRVGNYISLVVGAGAQVFLGGMVQVVAAGTATAATATAANATVGVALGDGAPGETINVEKSVFAFGNSAAADALTKADIGKPCYVVDDQTVAKTSNSNNRPIAGVVYDVDEYGVWVDFR